MAKKPSSRRREWVSTSDSEAIEGFGYLPARRELEVKFKHGERYAYLNVPRRIFDELRDAPSRGQFVADVVKRYAFEKR